MILSESCITLDHMYGEMLSYGNQRSILEIGNRI